MEKEELVVDGFVFPSFKEAEIALKEQRNIEVIRQRINDSDEKALYELFVKMVERDMFKTMVGFSFLYEIRHRLVSEFGYNESDLPLIRLPKRMEYDKVRQINEGVMESKLTKANVVIKRMRIALIAMAVMIVAMYVIAAVNPNAGYINAENKIVNKYSAWQEELEQRERVVREKEAELNIENGQ